MCENWKWAEGRTEWFKNNISSRTEQSSCLHVHTFWKHLWSCFHFILTDRGARSFYFIFFFSYYWWCTQFFIHHLINTSANVSSHLSFQYSPCLEFISAESLFVVLNPSTWQSLESRGINIIEDWVCDTFIVLMSNWLRGQTPNTGFTETTHYTSGKCDRLQGLMTNSYCYWTVLIEEV